LVRTIFCDFLTHNFLRVDAAARQFYYQAIEQSTRNGVELHILEKSSELKEKLNLELKLPKKDRKQRSIRIISNRARPDDGGDSAGENLCDYLKSSDKWKEIPFLLFCGVPSKVQRYRTDISRNIWISKDPKILSAFLNDIDLLNNEDLKRQLN